MPLSFVNIAKIDSPLPFAFLKNTNCKTNDKVPAITLPVQTAEMGRFSNLPGKPTDIRFADSNCRTIVTESSKKIFKTPKIKNQSNTPFYILRVDQFARLKLLIDVELNKLTEERAINQANEQEAVSIIDLPPGSSYEMKEKDQVSYTFYTLHQSETNPNDINISIRHRKMIYKTANGKVCNDENFLIKNSPDYPESNIPDGGTISIAKPTEPNSGELAKRVYQQDVGRALYYLAP